ncbi:hypothetical protein JG688_00012783 [Phytophthora aleatoria]|uniref:Uncharacterized protein n=1 Tax=Phytophthora aleatoria TaxID=2496075 RepID=A0A8J5LZK6_9STRA|nr:hypothetical protein JG688_00012783 [Phytophthora aleatoria]
MHDVNAATPHRLDVVASPYATNPTSFSSNVRSATFTPMETDDPTIATSGATDSASPTSESTFRSVNIGMGCPEFQLAYDSATPGSSTPFRSFTLTKGSGYAYVGLRFSKLWIPSGVSVVLRAVEGFDTPDRMLNLSRNYPSGRNYGNVVAPPVLTKEFRIEFYRDEVGPSIVDDNDFIGNAFSVADSDSKCFGFVVESYDYVLMNANDPIVATDHTNRVFGFAFCGTTEDPESIANTERIPEYTPPVHEATLALTPRLTLDGAIILAAGFVTIDKVEFTLTKDTDISFAVVSVEIADNDTFVDLNGDCRASYLDSVLYLFPKDSSSSIFFIDDSNVNDFMTGGSVSFRDPHKATSLKKGSYVLAIAPTGSSSDDALADVLHFAKFDGAQTLPMPQATVEALLPAELSSFVQICQWPDSQAAAITVNTAELQATQRWGLADALVSALSRADVQELTIVASLHLPYAKDGDLNVFYSGLNGRTEVETKLSLADPAWEAKDLWLSAFLHLIKVEQWPRTHLLLAKGYKPGRDLSGTYEAVDALGRALQLFTKDKVTVDIQEVQRDLPRRLRKEKITSTAGDDHLTLLYH